MMRLRYVLLSGAMVACNVAGKSDFADAVDATQAPTADAGPPDAQPVREPIECVSGPVKDQTAATGEYVRTTTWWAPLGQIDPRRTPRITAWACDFTCSSAQECRPCGVPAELFPTQPPCTYTAGTVDHMTPGACFPAEVRVDPDGQAFALCGYALIYDTMNGQGQRAKFDRADVVYATIEE